MKHGRPSKPRRASRWTLVLVAMLVLLVSGCLGGSGKTKAGVEANRTLRLVMQGPEGEDTDAAYFAAEVKRRTNGRIQIVVGGDYPSSDPDNELRLARALGRGDVTLGYVPSRAWEREGLLSFRALQSPLLITNYELLRRVVSGPIAAHMLSSLDRVGLVGLALVPDELRRPLGRRPLLSPGDYRGARIRVVTSPTSELLVRALDATPITDLSARGVLAALRRGRVDGVESSTRPIGSNSYTAAAPYLPSNLVLFAKAQTIVVGKRVFTGLSAADQAALRAAATATMAHAHPAAAERIEARQLCGQGLRLVSATSGDLESLRRAAAPVYAVLERGEFTKRAINEIEGLKAATDPSTATLPPCPRVVAGGASATGSSLAFPTGTFETRITVADLAGTGFPPSNAHFERLTFN